MSLIETVEKLESIQAAMMAGDLSAAQLITEEALEEQRREVAQMEEYFEARAAECALEYEHAFSAGEFEEVPF